MLGATLASSQHESLFLKSHIYRPYDCQHGNDSDDQANLSVLLKSRHFRIFLLGGPLIIPDKEHSGISFKCIHFFVWNNLNVISVK